MKIKRLISVLACLLAICCLLTACDTSNLSSNGSTTTPSGSTTTTSTEKTTKPTPSLNFGTTRNEPKPEDMPHDEQLLLGGINITSFRIVYGATPLLQKISNTKNTIAGDIATRLQGENKDCKFDYESAVRLQTLIKDLFGYDVEIIDSSKAAKDISQYEIVLGNANSRVSHIRTTEGLKDEAYVCKFNTAVTNTPYHYIVAGGSYGATWHAIDAIEQYLRDELAKDPNAVIDIGKDLDLSGTYKFKTVACIGDSITRGSQAIPNGKDYGSANGFAASLGNEALDTYLEKYLSYPATLQRELWKDYLVYNYGFGWATMIDTTPNAPDNGPYYYNDTSKFASCLARSNEANFDFDLVLIMLGTNDAGYFTWNEASKKKFLDESENIITKIKAGSPNAKFVMMNAPHRCDGNAPLEKDVNTRAMQKETAIALKAKGYDVYHYDMEAYTIENLSETGGVCGSTKSDELNVHDDFYNIRTETSKSDTTHPNHRGYGMIAAGMKDLVEYMLAEGEAPKYMINIDNP